MKRITTIILSFILVTGALLLSGCDNSDNGGLGRKIPISKLKEDIVNDSQIQSCFTSAYVNESRYSVETIEIVKEQENEKDIITYSNVVLENAYFSVSLYVKTIYNYYDHGGWIMDELDIEEMKEVTPINGPEKDLVNKYLVEHYSLSGMTDSQTSDLMLEKAEVIATESVLKDNTTAYAYVTYQTDAVSVNGYVVFTLTTNGWLNEDTTRDQPNYHIVDYNADYSKALGLFGIKNSILFESVEINIISIDETNVTFEVIDFNMPGFGYCDGVIGSEQTATFDPLTGSFDIGSYSDGRVFAPLTMVYNTENDTWTMVASTLRRQ